MTGGVRKRGNTWYYYFDVAKIDGKRKKIERKGGKTKKEAQKALQKAIFEYEEAGSSVNTRDISVSDYMDYWMREYVCLNCKFSTIEGYRVIIEKHIKPSIGYYKLKQIKANVLQQLINEKYLIGFGKHYLANILSVLSSSFKYAVYPYQFIKENPMQYVKLPKYEQTKKDIDKKVISPTEFKKILERFPEGSSFFVPLNIAYYTGTRIGECCALTWDDINFEEKTISINKTIQRQENKNWYFGTPKTSKSNRSILIGDTLLNILKRHKALQERRQKELADDYIYYYKTPKNKIYAVTGAHTTTDNKVEFISTNEKGSLISPESFRYCSRVINYELLIPFNFHALRHTHATLLLENGAKIKDVQKRLGHSRLATTMDIYVHSTNKMAQETVDIFEKLLNEE